MNLIEAFIWGFVGSVAVEVIAIIQFYTSANSNLPERYSQFAFYVVRFLLALIGGGLAVAYNIDNPILAINIGAATPLIIQTFAQNPPSGN
jgi:hypothetical protein